MTIRSYWTLGLVLALSACGLPSVKTKTEIGDLSGYKKLYLAEINITSKETDTEALEWSREIRAYARDRFSNAISKSKYELLEQSPAELGDTLFVYLNIYMIQGSQFLRMFTAGQYGSGAIKINLQLIEPEGDVEKFSAVSESHVSMGLWGGSMGIAANEAIAQLAAEFGRELQK